MSRVAPPASSISSKQLLLLALILLGAIGVRFARIGTAEAHFDELWHLELSTGRGSAHNELPRNVLLPDAPDVTSITRAPPFVAIWTHLDSVTHPPLYPLALRAWRAAMGESVGAARALSAIASVVCVIVLFDVVRLLHGTRAALWAAAILAAAPTQIEIAQESRNYAFALLWLLLAADEAARIRAVGPNTLRLAALGCASAAALLTHYFVAPVLAAIALFAWIDFKGAARRSSLCAMLAGVALFLIVWGPMMPRQLRAVREASIKGSLGETAPSPKLLALQRLAALPLRQLFEPPALLRASLPAVALLIVLSVTIYLAPWLTMSFGRHRDLLLWAFWLGACAIFLVALDLARDTRHLAQLRHTTFAGPPVVAIIASAASSMMTTRARLLRNGLPALALAACVATVATNAWVGSADDNPHFSQIGRCVAAAPDERAPVIFFADPQAHWWADLLYMGTAHYSRTFPRPAARLDAPASHELLAELRRRGPRLWLVRGPSNLSAEQILPGAQTVATWEEPTLAQIFLMRWSDSTATQPK